MTARWSPPPQPGPPIVITPRLAQVLTQLHLGKSNADIGRALFLGVNTIKTHMRQLLRRAGARDRAHLVALTCARTVIVDEGRAA